MEGDPIPNLIIELLSINMSQFLYDVRLLHVVNVRLLHVIGRTIMAIIIGNCGYKFTCTVWE